MLHPHTGQHRPLSLFLSFSPFSSSNGLGVVPDISFCASARREPRRRRPSSSSSSSSSSLLLLQLFLPFTLQLLVSPSSSFRSSPGPLFPPRCPLKNDPRPPGEIRVSSSLARRVTRRTLRTRSTVMHARARTHSCMCIRDNGHEASALRNHDQDFHTE